MKQFFRQFWKNQLLLFTLDLYYYYFFCINLTHKLGIFSASKFSWKMELLKKRNMGRC